MSCDRAGLPAKPWSRAASCPERSGVFTETEAWRRGDGRLKEDPAARPAGLPDWETPGLHHTPGMR
jgi:hypothetical protein